MAVQFKVGVKLHSLQPQMLIALEVVRAEFNPYGLDTVVTSANDGGHRVNSLHYSGAALDFRTKHAPGIINGIVANVKKRLVPLGFDVIFEDAGGANEHLHIEYDPK